MRDVAAARHGRVHSGSRLPSKQACPTPYSRTGSRSDHLRRVLVASRLRVLHNSLAGWAARTRRAFELRHAELWLRTSVIAHCSMRGPFLAWRALQGRRWWASRAPRRRVATLLARKRATASVRSTLHAWLATVEAGRAFEDKNAAAELRIRRRSVFAAGQILRQALRSLAALVLCAWRDLVRSSAMALRLAALESQVDRLKLEQRATAHMLAATRVCHARAAIQRASFCGWARFCHAGAAGEVDSFLDSWQSRSFGSGLPGTGADDSQGLSTSPWEDSSCTLPSASEIAGSAVISQGRFVPLHSCRGLPRF